MTVMETITKERLEKLEKERSGWDIHSDAEYYYERGKRDAVEAISSFIRDGGGTYRSLLYDYLKADDYCGYQSHGALEISNAASSMMENKKS